jgi:IS605 OrfB family transposase
MKNKTIKRNSRVYLKYLNIGKYSRLRQFLEIYCRVVQYYISYLWSKQDFSSKLKYEDIKRGAKKFQVGTHLVSAAYKQAKSIIISQRRKSNKKRRMPRFKAKYAIVNQMFYKLDRFKGFFDYVLRFRTKLANRDVVVILFKNTKHLQKYQGDNWSLANIGMGLDDKGLFIDLIYEKPKPQLKTEGDILGIDLGYRISLATSRKELIGEKLREIIEKFDKRRKSTHQYIQTELDRLVKQIDLSNVKVVVLEKLYKVKSNTRGRFSRYSNRLLSHWHYVKVVHRLKCRCEELGIRVAFVSPWRTSTTCPMCDNWDSKSRKDTKFECSHCGYTEHSDVVGALNLVKRFTAGRINSACSLQAGFVDGNKCP